MKLVRRIQFLFRRRRMEEELAEEMEFHRTLLAQEHGGDRAAAARAWGNTALAREDARGVWIAYRLESLWQDIVYAIRGMRLQPGFTLTAITALAIAIGLNTSVFTLFNAVAWRPWPVPEAGRVVKIERVMQTGAEKGAASGFGVAEWRYAAEHSKAFSGLVLARNGEKTELNGRPLPLSWVSANYFSALRVSMARGRGFLPAEDLPEAPEAVVVVSFDTWQNRLGADPQIVGKVIRLDEVAFTVVGIAPESFPGTDSNRTGAWAPLPAWRVLRPHDANVLSFLTRLEHCCSSMAGRLAPGYTRAEGAAEIELLMGQVHGKTERDRGSSVVTAGTAILASGGRNKAKVVPLFTAMFIAVSLVLLLACANVGNLLLARAAARRSEIAVRLSLGGTRARLIRQLLVESLVLALSASVIGLAVAWTAPAAILSQLAPDNALKIVPDLTVCLYTAGLCLLTCLIFGLAPALHGTKGQIAPALQRGEMARSTLPLRSLLLGAQVCVSVILLAAAGILVGGLQRARHQDTGFRVEGVSLISLDLPAARYSGKQAAAFASDLQHTLAQAESLPPVAISNDAPMANSRTFTSLRLSEAAQEEQHRVQLHEVNGAYFDVLRIPVVAGRNLTAADVEHHVALVNETAARRFWGGQDPVGRKAEIGGEMYEVAGVVKDAFTTNLDAVQPQAYWPMAGRLGVPKLLFAGTPAERERLVSLVTQLEPKGRFTIVGMEENLRSALEPARVAATLAGILGGLALALASLGISGVFAYMVRQRTREIGIRMALGAHPVQIVRLVLTGNLRALLWGLAAGAAGTAASTRLLKNMVGSVQPFEPAAYAGVLVLLIIAAIAASAGPARRAASVDPLTALRWE